MSCNFPVCPSSPPSCILAAFQQSGYFSALEQQGNQQAINAAQQDPVGWLSSHPYLYNAYPQYFNSTCGAPVSPGRPPDYLTSGGNYDYVTQQNVSQVSNQVNQNAQNTQNLWQEFLQNLAENLQWLLTGHGIVPPSIQQMLNQTQQNAPPQGSPNNPYPPPQVPQGTGYGQDGQKPEWLLPFEDFGSWLLSVGKGINDFLTNLGNVYAEAVTVSGEHPLGVVMLIVFFLALIAIFIFLPKL